MRRQPFCRDGETMNIEVVENPEPQLIDFLDQQIAAFNQANREPAKRKALAVQITNDNHEVVAGAGGCTFGHWLLLDTLWVSDKLRTQGVGSKILAQMELAAKNRGCDQCLLNTLDIQAMPFYKKHGYFKNV